ncbi:MAG: hypothetical protein ACI9ZV_000962 [Candidatus Azotimanducaceae bacterium]|jgi:hypothetical protein
MLRAFATRIVVSLLALWGVCLCGLTAAPALRSASNEHFEVIGFDLRSVSYINELSLFTVQIAERYLKREGLAYPTPILISLRPEEHVDFEGDYRIRLAEPGSVQLDIRWEDSMTLERSCQLISEALLAQYAVYNHGFEAASRLRAWPVVALSRDVYFTLRPANFIELLNRTRKSELPSLTVVLEPSQADAAHEEVTFGYWLLQAMKSGALERSAVSGLFEQAVAGIDIEEALTSALQPSGSTAELLPGQTWWVAQMDALLSREHEVIESMDISRGWLAALAHFDRPLTLESEEVTLNFRSLWKYRAQPEVQTWVQARYEILRLRMTRINPAYFNPARSLGVIYEGILSDVAAHKHLHSMAIYLSDWEDAKEMQKQVGHIFENK